MFFLSFGSFPIDTTIYNRYWRIIIMNNPKEEGKMNISVHSFI